MRLRGSSALSSLRFPVSGRIARFASGVRPGAARCGAHVFGIGFALSGCQQRTGGLALSLDCRWRVSRSRQDRGHRQRCPIHPSAVINRPRTAQRQTDCTLAVTVGVATGRSLGQAAVHRFEPVDMGPQIPNIAHLDSNLIKARLRDDRQIRPFIDTRMLWRFERKDSDHEPDRPIIRPPVPVGSIRSSTPGAVRYLSSAPGPVRAGGGERDREALKCRCPTGMVGSCAFHCGPPPGASSSRCLGSVPPGSAATSAVHGVDVTSLRPPRDGDVGDSAGPCPGRTPRTYAPPARETLCQSRLTLPRTSAASPRKPRKDRWIRDWLAGVPKVRPATVAIPGFHTMFFPGKRGAAPVGGIRRIRPGRSCA